MLSATIQHLLIKNRINPDTYENLLLRLSALGIRGKDANAIILRTHGAARAEAVVRHYSALAVRLKPAQIIKIATGSAKNDIFEMLIESSPALEHMGIFATQITELASKPNAKANIKALLEYAPQLLRIGYTIHQIYMISLHQYSSKLLQDLTAKTHIFLVYGFTIEEITTILQRKYSYNTIQVISKFINVFITHGFTIHQLASLATFPEGERNVEAFLRYYEPLLHFGVTIDHIHFFGCYSTGYHHLEKIHNTLVHMKAMGADIRHMVLRINYSTCAKSLLTDLDTMLLETQKIFAAGRRVALTDSHMAVIAAAYTPTPSTPQAPAKDQSKLYQVLLENGFRSDLRDRIIRSTQDLTPANVISAYMVMCHLGFNHEQIVAVLTDAFADHHVQFLTQNRERLFRTKPKADALIAYLNDKMIPSTEEIEAFFSGIESQGATIQPEQSAAKVSLQPLSSFFIPPSEKNMVPTMMDHDFPEDLDFEGLLK